MQGLHLTADLHGCAPEHAAMTDAEALRALCVAAVGRSGLQGVAELFHRFSPSTPTCASGEPSGVTGVVLLAESHLAVHTWPELGAVTLDVYVCNYGGDNSPAARALLQSLIIAFAPRQVEQHALERGAAPYTAAR